MGDPAGIGPEIIVKAAQRLRSRIEAGSLRLLVIGDNAALEAARLQLAPDLAIPAVAESDTQWPALAALQAGPDGKPIQPGVVSARAAASRSKRSSAASASQWPAAAEGS